MSERQERKERYHRVVKVVDYHSGVITPVAKETNVRRICVDQIGMDQHYYENHLQAACNNGDLVRGSGYLWHPENGEITEAIEWMIENVENPQEFVANANKYK